VNDGYTTDDMFFAAAMVMVHSSPDGYDYVTKRIEIDERGLSRVTLDIASHDAEQWFSEYQQGILGISDLKNLSRRYQHLVYLCKELRRSDARVWIAPEAPMTPSKWNSIQAQGQRINQMRDAFLAAEQRRGK
jgi:hypothetical protein